MHGTTRYTYDRSSLITGVSYPNSTTADHTYDGAMRVTEIHNQQNNATVSRYTYAYDANGNRTKQRETNGGAEEITAYNYDVNDRLMEVVYAQGTAGQETVTYDYDAAYNRTSEITRNNSNVVTQNKIYRYNQRNQLTNVDDTLDASNDASYAFDLNGNQIQKVTCIDA